MEEVELWREDMVQGAGREFALLASTDITRLEIGIFELVMEPTAFLPIHVARNEPRQRFQEMETRLSR